MSAIGKKIIELRVSDLKTELEEREMDIVGSKAMLIERLEKALTDEGHDPATYEFMIGVEKKNLSPNKNSPKIKAEPIDDENEEEHKENGDSHDGGDEVDEVGECDDECIPYEMEDEDETNATLVVVKQEKSDEVDESAAEANKYDQEESINLTIGEDEQKLLHDEANDDKLADAGATAAASKEAKDNINEKIAAGKEKDDKKNSKDDDNKSKNKDNSESEKNATPKKSSQGDDKEKSSNATSKVTPSRSTTSTSKSTAASSRNLWVSGLSTLTRASDLKTIFSKFGKVSGAKVVTNTRTPGTRCYGYVTMFSSSDAGRCIENLHRTELHGRIISVERTKNEIGATAGHVNRDNMLKNLSPSDNAEKTRDDDKKSISSKDAKSHDDKRKHDDKSHSRRDHHHRDKERGDSKKLDDSSANKDSKERRDSTRRTSTGSRSIREHDRDRGGRGQRERERERDRERERERERARQREILSYQKIREERERQRLRERERELREEERRRREIRDRQRQEEQRLEEERKKLAQERYRLEREKAELLRLERERQKLEREKIELERLELKRQQMKIMQSRDDPVKRLGTKRTGDDHYNDAPDRKRGSQNDARFDAPPPPRFDASLITSTRSYDKKRDDFTASSGNKRAVLEDYTTSTKYSATAKRTVGDDYSGVSTKRAADEYNKRGGANDYLPSGNKRSGIDEYGSKSSRDDYKREVEVRHIPSNSVSGGGSYHKNGSNTGGGGGSGGRYNDASASNYRRGGGLDDLSIKNRYDNSGGYSSMNSSSGNNGMWSSTGHNSSGISSLMHGGGGGGAGGSNWPKALDDSSWRQMQSSQDRYDRTYNERSSGGYAGGGNSSAMFANSGRQQDRYGGGGGGGMSRY